MDKLLFAKKLRRNQTISEAKMWDLLRGRRFAGIKFRRQQPIDKYIVDFVSFDKKLIIEVDGIQHSFPENIEKDKVRTKFFTNQGYKVLRFWDGDVLQNQEGVLEVIFQQVNTDHS